MADGERLICASEALVDGGLGVRFELRRAGESLPAFVVRHRGQIHAYVNECRHQDSELDWNPGEFFDSAKLYLICATHGAVYQPEDGLCIEGPCRGARLMPVSVHEHDGRVFLSE
ncbi:MAG: Rieske 2Fe-2S domain-containing protein [Betaproteobacteria bacterium]|nr:MAG: Rieske 2Fe-2S domain-containing protein [Betaproteobacteria bacterium]